jgi:hypothetical protein
MSIRSFGCDRGNDYAVVRSRGISYDAGVRIRFTEPEHVLYIIAVGFLRKEQLFSLWLIPFSLRLAPFRLFVLRLGRGLISLCGSSGRRLLLLSLLLLRTVAFRPVRALVRLIISETGTLVTVLLPFLLLLLLLRTLVLLLRTLRLLLLLLLLWTLRLLLLLRLLSLVLLLLTLLRFGLLTLLLTFGLGSRLLLLWLLRSFLLLTGMSFRLLSLWGPVLLPLVRIPRLLRFRTSLLLPGTFRLFLLLRLPATFLRPVR